MRYVVWKVWYIAEGSQTGDPELELLVRACQAANYSQAAVA